MDREVNTSPPRPGASDSRLYLRDEELDRGVALILAGRQRLVRAADRARKAGGFSRAQMQALLAIRFQPGLGVAELRARMGATVPTFARLLAALDERALIARERDGEDRRRRRLALSPAGLDATQPVTEAMRDTLRDAYREAGPQAVEGARQVLEALGR